MARRESDPPEPELMAALGVSRNTLREAVRALVHTGVLSSRPGDGTYVAAADGLAAALARRFRNSESLEIIDVRRMIECEAAGMAARRRSAEDVTALRECERECARAAREGDRDSAIAAELRFHSAVVAATHNGLLLDLYTHMTEAVRDSIAAAVDAHTAYGPAHAQHERIISSIASNDPVAAELAATEHLESVAAMLGENGLR
ncbi:FadR/GntR family transcriptional regulator [Gordonia humi]|uniref:FadR/GntR family transcriptional regulator n=1 Tax=Gordonia humi TaxID=686429 RepID=UPI00361C98C4